MAEDAFGELELQHSDEELKNPPFHNKLLGAVSQLYEKKRVKAPTRKEPSLEVSEFHLSKADKKLGRVKVTDLAKVLNKRAIHAEISHKVKSAQKSSKTLPKPLEQSHANKINRVAGYESAKQQLNRWDAIVYQQRVAEQLSFPLKNETIKVHEDTDISKMFRKPTELELQMAEILKSDTTLQKEAEKPEEDYPLTLAEIIEKRKLMARLRAQQSYKQAKAHRHSKIKSKKFHQIQRRAKVKEQLKEFEELQKKDPEAALKKLEELERTRAEERVTLRHRSTGQWAKNLAVRAKYDKEARIALSEQLSKSRELTVKLAHNRDSESEKEEEEVDTPIQPAAKEDPNNPWVVKRSNEMEEFVSGYRKYWETEGKALDENKIPVTAAKVISSSVDHSLSVNPDKENEQATQPPPKPAQDCPKSYAGSDYNATLVIDNKDERVSCNSFKKDSLPLTSVSIFSTSKPATSKFQVSYPLPRNQLQKDIKNSQVRKLGRKNDPPLNHFKVQDLKFNVLKKKAISQSTPSSWIISDIEDTKNIHDQAHNSKESKEHKLTSSGNSFKVTTNKNITNKPKLKSLCKTNSSKTNALSSHSVKGDKRQEKSLDKLFEEVEDQIQNRIQEKIKKLKESLSKKRKHFEQVNIQLEAEDNIPSLELKKQKISADVDEELIENTGTEENIVKARDPLSKALNVFPNGIRESNDIDPNKFLKVTPRILSSQLPEMMTEGDDVVDDEETTAGDRHLTISEAFADDDVVDQFQKEKEEEVKKDGVGDVDLSLPGWGSWAGHNMKAISRRKRKKFVVKFPKAIPRRDTNRGNVIINEDADKPIKDHQVSDVPFPFTSVKEYEASIRAPLGTTWVPQTAHKKLTLPPLVTKLGAIIAPMDDSQLVKNQTTLPNSKKKTKPANVNKINKK